MQLHASVLDTPPTLSANTYLATWIAGASERRYALATAVISLAFFAAIAPFASRQLPQVWAFIPVYEAALIVSDLITAVLLTGQFRISRSKAVLVLACGYLFTAFATVAHGLSFPGLFAPGGLLGAGPQTTAWLYMFWHGGFPAFVVAYAMLRASKRETFPTSASAALAIAGAVACAAAAVVAFALLCTLGQGLLPPIMQGNRYTPFMISVVSIVWLISLFALVVLWRRRPHSVLDVWLMVVMCAWLFDVALSAVLNAGRFDLGFYAGRIYGLLAASFVLGVLLLENGTLHSRLMDAHAKEQRRSLDLERLSARLVVLNTSLESTNKQLADQTRLKSEFLASMSHELRTPLNAIIGFSDMLKDGNTHDPDKQQRFARYIFQSGQHLLALINDILDLSKIEAGKFEVALAPVPVRLALSDAMAMLADQAHAKQIRFELETPGALGTLQLDRRRLKQILLNLLSNAMKFTPTGGEVRLRADKVDRERAANVLPGRGDGLRMPLPPGEQEFFLEIAVSDSGIGIGPADLRKLFSPFMQVPNALTRSNEGTGLGLVMVHRLAELHGGTVAVTSQPGAGSCFTVWLPWREDLQAETDEHPPSPALPGRDRLALVVEDNEEAAALMRAQLESSGFSVRCVESAEAALALVGEMTPDLITLDIVLPDMDGWQFLARLKATPAWEGVPVVVVSIVADEGRGFALGAALVLQKPVARDALAKGLERLGLAPHAQRDVSVLVIDDDPSAVELLATYLHERDYVVLRALGGREGIDLARRYRPDLISLDLEMPEVNGFDVVAALRSDASTAQIPIVVVTARDLTSSARHRLNGQVLDIVDKAVFSRDGFIGEVHRALSRVPTSAGLAGALQ